MNKCSTCGKIYKRKKAYDNHILLCSISPEDITSCILPSRKEMWYIIKKLVKKTSIQQRKIEVLERVVNKDVKKINILEWLNNNIKLDTSLDNWLNNKLTVTMDDIECIFASNFTRGLHRILDNNIDEKTSPFKAFSHKSTQLYIYNKSIWKKATKFVIKNIFLKIQVKILKKSSEWEQNLDSSKIFGDNNLEYLQNNKKIIVTGDRNKERCYKNIQKIIIELTKVNMNDMTKFKFYI